MNHPSADQQGERETQFDYDLFVIGAGSGGVRAARMAAATGARVAIAEARHFGGTCVNVGCVPKKLFVYASQFSEAFEDCRGYGWQPEGDIKFDWDTLRRNKDQEIKRLNGIYWNLLQNAGVSIYEGRATIAGPHEVTVNSVTHRARYILIATGGEPFVPHLPGAEWIKNSDDFFYLDQLPSDAIVVGGGYIAVEFAGILNGLGVSTRLLYRGDLILRGFDQHVREFVTEEMVKKGIGILTEVDVVAVRQLGQDQYAVELSNGDELRTGMVLYATGRKPLVHGIGLEKLSIKLNAAGEIEVNEFYQSNIPSIYALGDITPGPKLTPVALAEAMTLVRHLFQGGSQPLDYEYIPTAVFCQPNIGTVGLTEDEAQASLGSVRVYETRFRAMKHTISGRQERSYMKLIVDDSNDRVVGAHVVGPDAGEMIQGFAVALRAGATKQVFDTTIGIHPTAAEELVTLREPTRRHMSGL